MQVTIPSMAYSLSMAQQVMLNQGGRLVGVSEGRRSGTVATS